MNDKLTENIKQIYLSGKRYSLCEYMFGVLKMDHNDPLSCVSEANNSFSIDYWKGCAYQCAYCHIQGIYEDLDENYKMIKKIEPRSQFSIEEIINALIQHPYFEKNKSIVSIATSSTEPFASNQTIESTLKIMEYFTELGYKNPFWIVTKAGIPNYISDRLKKICDNGNNIMISICWAGNPQIIEPAQHNRFKNIEKLKDTGVTVSWYLRPLVAEWGANKEHIEQMMKMISSNYGEYIDMIVPGGLRWTEGIEFGLKYIRGLKMPNLIREHNKKTLSSELEDDIIELCQKYFPNKPVYFHSSCAISHMLNRNNVALLNLYDETTCNKSICSNRCKNMCRNLKFNDKLLKECEEKLINSGIKISLKKVDSKNKILSKPNFDSFTYSEKQQIKKTLALVANEKGVIKN